MKEVKAYHCPNCAKVYSEKTLASFNSHVQKCGIESFSCDICWKKFTSLATLRLHMRKFHTDCYSFACETCGREFKSKFSLNQHEKVHSDLKERRRISCEYCEKTFIWKSSMRRHLQDHFSSKIKAYTCACGETFNKYSVFYCHKTSCEAAADEKKSLETCQTNSKKKAEDENDKQPIHATEYVHTCQFCGEGFSERQELSNHVDTCDPFVQSRKNGKTNYPEENVFIVKEKLSKILSKYKLKAGLKDEKKSPEMEKTQNEGDEGDIVNEVVSDSKWLEDEIVEQNKIEEDSVNTAKDSYTDQVLDDEVEHKRVLVETDVGIPEEINDLDSNIFHRVKRKRKLKEFTDFETDFSIPKQEKKNNRKKKDNEATSSVIKSRRIQATKNGNQCQKTAVKSKGDKRILTSSVTTNSNCKRKQPREKSVEVVKTVAVDTEGTNDELDNLEEPLRKINTITAKTEDPGKNIESFQSIDLSAENVKSDYNKTGLLTEKMDLNSTSQTVFELESPNYMSAFTKEKTSAIVYICKSSVDCSERFTEKRLLLDHKRNIHDENQEYVCAECDKLFTSVSDVQCHVKLVHSDMKVANILYKNTDMTDRKSENKQFWISVCTKCNVLSLNETDVNKGMFVCPYCVTSTVGNSTPMHNHDDIQIDPKIADGALDKSEVILKTLGNDPTAVTRKKKEAKFCTEIPHSTFVSVATKTRNRVCQKVNQNDGIAEEATDEMEDLNKKHPKKSTSEKNAKSPRHYQRWASVLYICKTDNCSASFGFRNQLISHKKEVHHEKLEYICEECKKAFAAYSILKSHLRMAHLHLKAVNMAYKNTDLRCSNNSEQVYQLSVCTTCGQTLSGDNSDDHNCNSVRLNFFCPYCDSFSSTYKKCQEHLKGTHPGEVCTVTLGHKYHNLRGKVLDKALIVEDSSVTCATCDKTFETNEKLQSHMNKEHVSLPYCCGVCLLSYGRKTALKRHMVIHNNNTICCQTCSKRFYDRKTLEAHERVHTGERPFQCDICGNRYCDEKAVKKHMQIRHIEVFRIRYKDTKLAQRLAMEPQGCVCPVCGAMLDAPSLLEPHLRSHKKNEPIQCVECSKTFTTKKQLKYHQAKHRKCDTYLKKNVISTQIVSVNSTAEFKKVFLDLKTVDESDPSGKPFQCSACHKRFKRVKQLNQHIHSMHIEDKVKSFCCNICERGFPRKSLFDAHMRVHTDSRPYQCRLCRKSYKQVAHVREHLRAHGKNMFFCKYCPRAFKTQSTLSAHIMTHCDVHPFKCPVESCTLQFRDISQLLVHGAKCFVENSENQSFICKFCNQAYSNSNDVILHLYIHENDGLFPCGMCDLKLNSFRHLYFHKVKSNHFLESEVQNSESNQDWINVKMNKNTIGKIDWELGAEYLLAQYDIVKELSIDNKTTLADIEETGAVEETCGNAAEELILIAEQLTHMASGVDHYTEVVVPDQGVAVPQYDDNLESEYEESHVLVLESNTASENLGYPAVIITESDVYDGKTNVNSSLFVTESDSINNVSEMTGNSQVSLATDSQENVYEDGHSSLQISYQQQEQLEVQEHTLIVNGNLYDTIPLEINDKEQIENQSDKNKYQQQQLNESPREESLDAVEARQTEDILNDQDLGIRNISEENNSTFITPLPKTDDIPENTTLVEEPNDGEKDYVEDCTVGIVKEENSNMDDYTVGIVKEENSNMDDCTVGIVKEENSNMDDSFIFGNFSLDNLGLGNSGKHHVKVIDTQGNEVSVCLVNEKGEQQPVMDSEEIIKSVLQTGKYTIQYAFKQIETTDENGSYPETSLQLKTEENGILDMARTGEADGVKVTDVFVIMEKGVNAGTPKLHGKGTAKQMLGKAKIVEQKQVTNTRKIKGEFVCPSSEADKPDDSEEFSYRVQLKYYEEKDEEVNPYACDQCSLRFRYVKNLNHHKKTHLSNDKRKYQCKTCGAGFHVPSTLKIHMRSHTGDKPFNCNKCGKKFRQRGHLQVHLRSHEFYFPFKCTVCNKMFRVNSHLTKHMTSHAVSSDTVYKQFNCNICNQTFVSGRDLKFHQVKTHLGKKAQEDLFKLCNALESPDKEWNSDKPNSPKEIKKYNFICDVCGFASKFAHCAKLHRLRHDMGSDFKCENCDRAFSSELLLKEHIRQRHSDRVACEVCGLQFKNRSSLQAHLLRVHQKGSVKYQCQRCKEMYTVKNNFVRHLNSCMKDEVEKMLKQNCIN